MSKQSAYHFIVDVLKDDTEIVRKATFFCKCGLPYQLSDTNVRLRARITKEQIIQALSDGQADEEDVVYLKEMLRNLYDTEIG